MLPHRSTWQYSDKICWTIDDRSLCFIFYFKVLFILMPIDFSLSEVTTERLEAFKVYLKDSGLPSSFGTNLVKAITLPWPQCKEWEGNPVYVYVDPCGELVPGSLNGTGSSGIHWRAVRGRQCLASVHCNWVGRDPPWYVGGGSVGRAPWGGCGVGEWEGYECMIKMFGIADGEFDCGLILVEVVCFWWTNLFFMDW